MQRNKGGYISAGCAVMLLGTTLAGCGGGTSSDKPAAGNKAAGGAQAEKPLSITWMRFEHPTQALLSDSVVVKEVLKRKNVKLELQSTPQSNYDDKKKTLIATNTLPDVLLVKQDDITNFADTGIFLDLTPYLDKMPNFKKAIADNPEINKTKVEGKLYGFPLAQRVATSQSGLVPVIRVDLLKKLNIPTPATYEELYQAMKKLKEAYPNSYPFTSRAANGLTGTENLVNAVAFAFGSGYTNINGTKVYFEPKDNKYKFGPFSPEFKDAITYLHKLYKEKLLDPDYTTATSQIWQEKLSSGKSFYYQDNTGFGANFNQALQKVDKDAKFDLLPILASDKGVKRGLMYQLDHLAESYVVSAKVKNPEKIVEFIDWMYSEEGIRLTSWGVEGEHYTMENGKAKLKDELYNQFKDKNDPYSAIKSMLGSGYSGLALYADETPAIPYMQKEATEWSDKNLQAIKDGQAFRFAYDPVFTKDEREKLKQLRTQLDAYMAQTMDKFIMSDGAIEKEWDNFVKQCREKGAEQIESIYNAALSRVK
ncbi:extracellular solute-binding protein [Paenibacillus thalictri]|uniref:Extracellular solute-binding protein n=1 Tax=Paenibacillus thalictri TaxID=2527873 RepID=A0A4Q9DY31_9BACL|nr:extracellular solute-binding protein [Paenibacillus thalictri]TBL80793.1 extracellular solute-binding protein [Paenibacillus thalictri]